MPGLDADHGLPLDRWDQPLRQMASLNPKPDIVLTDRGQQSDNIIRFGRHLLFAHDLCWYRRRRTAVSFTETSRPTKTVILSLLPLLPGPEQPRFAHHKWKGCAPNIPANSQPTGAYHHLWRAQGPRKRDFQPGDGQRQQSTPTTPPAPSSVSPDSQTSTSAPASGSGTLHGGIEPRRLASCRRSGHSATKTVKMPSANQAACT